MTLEQARKWARERSVKSPEKIGVYQDEKDNYWTCPVVDAFDDDNCVATFCYGKEVS